MVPKQPQSGHEDCGPTSRTEASSAPSRYSLSTSFNSLIPAFACGLLARILTAWLGPGFHARDDYFHVMAPALAWLEDPSFSWEQSALPGSGLRSHLFPRLIQSGLIFCQNIGISNPETALSVLHTGLGIYSALVIPATWFLCRRLECNPKTISLATWLVALHFAMPYVGTRLLIESMAIPPLIFGLALCANLSLRGLLLGGFFIGLSTWFRYQVGAAALGLVLGLFYNRLTSAGFKATIRPLGALALGGLFAVALQGIYDLVTTGQFLGPVVNNILYNLDPPGSLTRSNPLSYLGFWLLLTLPPASLVILPAVVRSAHKLQLITWPFTIFLVLHSLIGHKEERFMIPMLPLFLVLLASVPHEIAETQGRLGVWMQKWWPTCRAYFIALHVAGLLLVVTSQSQRNLRDTMSTLRIESGLTHLVSIGPEIQDYFLGSSRQLYTFETRHFDALWLRHTLDTISPESPTQVHFISFEPDRVKMQIILMAEGLQCQRPESITGWWIDRLSYKLNPKHNRRRSTIDIWRCRIPAIALRGHSDFKRVARVSKPSPNLSTTESVSR